LDENENEATTPLDSSNGPMPKPPMTPLTTLKHPVYLMTKMETRKSIEHMSFLTVSNKSVLRTRMLLSQMLKKPMPGMA
jgi:hypothetical protein